MQISIDMKSPNNLVNDYGDTSKLSGLNKNNILDSHSHQKRKTSFRAHS